MNDNTRFAIKVGDTSPTLEATLTDHDDEPINVTDAEVTFVMTKVGYTDPVIEGSASVNDGEAGEVEYEWESGDTDESGIYEAEFEIEYADGHTETSPSDGYIYVRIRPELA